MTTEKSMVNLDHLSSDNPYALIDNILSDLYCQNNKAFESLQFIVYNRLSYLRVNDALKGYDSSDTFKENIMYNYNFLHLFIMLQAYIETTRVNVLPKYLKPIIYKGGLTEFIYKLDVIPWINQLVNTDVWLTIPNAFDLWDAHFKDNEEHFDYFIKYITDLIFEDVAQSMVNAIKKDKALKGESSQFNHLGKFTVYADLIMSDVAVFMHTVDTYEQLIDTLTYRIDNYIYKTESSLGGDEDS